MIPRTPPRVHLVMQTHLQDTAHVAFTDSYICLEHRCCANPGTNKCKSVFGIHFNLKTEKKIDIMLL